jgi:hypothetical protein
MLAQLRRREVALEEEFLLTLFGICLEILGGSGCASAHCQCRSNLLYFPALDTPFLLWV